MPKFFISSSSFALLLAALPASGEESFAPPQAGLLHLETETVNILDSFRLQLTNSGEPDAGLPIVDGVSNNGEVGLGPGLGYWISNGSVVIPEAEKIQQDRESHHYEYVGTSATVRFGTTSVLTDFLFNNSATFDHDLRIVVSAPQDQGKGQRDTFFYLNGGDPFFEINFTETRIAPGITPNPPREITPPGQFTVDFSDPSAASKFESLGRSFVLTPTVYGKASGDNASTPDPFGILNTDIEVIFDHEYRKMEKPVVFLDVNPANPVEKWELKLGWDLEWHPVVIPGASALPSPSERLISSLVDGTQRIFDESGIPVRVTSDRSIARDAARVATAYFGDPIIGDCSLPVVQLLRPCQDPNFPPRTWGLAGGDPADQIPRQEFIVFADISSPAPDNAAEVTATIAHEAGHTFGAQHIKLQEGDELFRTSLLVARKATDRSLASGDGQFVQSAQEVDDDVDVRDGAVDVTHNPAYHIRRYAVGESPEFIEFSGVAPGTYDLDPSLVPAMPSLGLFDLILETTIPIDALYLRDVFTASFSIEGVGHYSLDRFSGPLAPGRYDFSLQLPLNWSFSIFGQSQGSEFLDLSLVEGLSGFDNLLRLTASSKTQGSLSQRIASSGGLQTVGSFSVEGRTAPVPVPLPASALLLLGAICTLCKFRRQHEKYA